MSQCHDTYNGRWRQTPHLPVTVQDLMTKDPITVEPAATVKDIAHIMLAHDVRVVPVVDMGDQLVGVVSEADLVCREGYPTVHHHSLAPLLDGKEAGIDPRWLERAAGLTAEEVMSTEITTCNPDEPVGLVTRRMLLKDLRSMPVVEGGRLIGVLSRHDILSLFDRPDSEVRGRVGELLAGPLWTPGHEISAEVMDGTVILTGSVNHPVDAGIVCSLISGLPGVIQVVDRISVTEPGLPGETDVEARREEHQP